MFGALNSPVGAEEGVMIHTGPPQVLTGFGTRQNQRHLTVLGLALQYNIQCIKFKIYSRSHLLPKMLVLPATKTKNLLFL